MAVLSDRLPAEAIKESWRPLLWAKVKKVLKRSERDGRMTGWVTGSRSTMTKKAAGNGVATGKRHKSERLIKLGAQHPNWFGFYKTDKHNRCRSDMSWIGLVLVKDGPVFIPVSGHLLQQRLLVRILHKVKHWRPQTKLQSVWSWGSFQPHCYETNNDMYFEFSSLKTGWLAGGCKPWANCLEDRCSQNSPCLSVLW